jgi:hypothetical protein
MKVRLGAMGLSAALAAIVLAASALGGCGGADSEPQTSSDGEQPATSASPGALSPERPYKLIFIHHSVGENWLADGNGGLGLALADAGYFVSDTNYGWGPAVLGGAAIGDRTDIGHWYLWFRDPETSPTVLGALYAESGQHSTYTRTAADPGGENEIVLFKSCYPNSALGDPRDPVPPIAENALRGQGSDSPAHTVAAAKGIYVDLLQYFGDHPEKLFVVITAPPIQDPSLSDNARAFNEWLVNEWLADYSAGNVVVWDFYNVLTGADAHHRVVGGRVEHVVGASNTAAYAPEGDDHPSAAGNAKATDEFVPFLNAAVSQWEEER